jgi:hypothetical protein
MAKGTNSTGARAQRVRDLAASADNIAAAAIVADETLAKARRDVLALAGAARKLAERLEREADASEVTP